MEKQTILIIEDETTINRIICNYFVDDGYNVLCAYDGIQGLKLFKENTVDLVCLDILMPYKNGWEVAKEIRYSSDIPIIMMSALSQEEDILKGYSLKVDDYITKPFSPKVLVAKTNTLLERLKKLELNKELSEVLELNGIKVSMSSYRDKRKLSDLLTLDELTGVFNRRYLDFRLKHMIEEAIEFNRTFGVLFFDIDHFKNVNDEYGHNIGDKVLKLVSSIINKNIRNNDILGRWGGEEFIAVISINNIKQLKLIAEKLRAKVAEARYLLEGKKNVSVTISIGGTMFSKEDSIDDVISRADNNMYISKDTGRNKSTIK